MKTVALSDVKDDLSRYLRLADYRLENDPRFLNRIAAARASLPAGRGVRLEDVAGASNKGAPADRSRRRTGTTRGRARSRRGG